VGHGQGVFVSKHSTAIQNRGATAMKKSAKTTIPAANTTQSTAPVQPVAFPARQKQQTAKEIIASNVQLLIEQLEAGHSEGLTAYLTAMGRFHRYSFGNILEIARQKPVT